MKIVLDTNCFISCIGKRSEYREVFDRFLQRRYTLCLSAEVLLEYEEKFNEFWGEEVCHNLLGVILTAENTSLHNIFYQFNLVIGDADDNKFADLFVAAAADLLVTNDNALLALSSVEFPLIKTATLQEFAKLIRDR